MFCKNDRIILEKATNEKPNCNGLGAAKAGLFEKVIFNCEKTKKEPSLALGSMGQGKTTTIYALSRH